MAGIALANLVACFSKSSIANIIKNPVASGQSSSSEESGSSKDSSTETQFQTKLQILQLQATRKKKKKAVVGIASGEIKISILVGKAIELAGGLGFINKGSTVLIKPNLNTGDP